jgi:urease accessory protein
MRAATGLATPTTTMADPGALRLFWWLSPAFPVGAYAYSHALEWAAETGDIRDEASCAAWIRDIMLDGAGRNDAILLNNAYRATLARNFGGLAEIGELALALAPSGELRLETAQQGRSFLDAIRGAWPDPLVERVAADLDEIAYPVALGIAAAAHAVPVETTIPGFLAAFLQNLVSAAMRLAPIGQNAGLRILAGLGPDLAALAAEIPHVGLDDIASSTFRADLGSFRHETQYTRLFRS